MEERKSWPIQSNEIENWPEGPAIGSASAILMDAESGIILYEKNIHDEMYPASTTKLMTCLLAMEKEGVKLSDMVPFSYEAVYTVPYDGSNMGMDAGESMTLEDCLYGILVLSANEVSNAVGEYVSGDAESFVELMNKRAKELGCLNTHFNNAHGYTDENHYTSAYDLALIAREFFKNELLAKISRTKRYHWYPTDTQPDDIDLPSKNYFLTGAYNYNGFIGSKTGFTDESRQVLVSCAERNGMKLICVVMKQETPY
ncbi:MAG: D-alanyl-D-alanine carboxypeptidase, partial [Lachnospiraceae bacterium]|nr:D-alanyl-D-alanine carboxypeptidase [Lachnospiraceae bacterium]